MENTRALRVINGACRQVRGNCHGYLKRKGPEVDNSILPKRKLSISNSIMYIMQFVFTDLFMVLLIMFVVNQICSFLWLLPFAVFSFLTVYKVPCMRKTTYSNIKVNDRILKYLCYSLSNSTDNVHH